MSHRLTNWIKSAARSKETNTIEEPVAWDEYRAQSGLSFQGSQIEHLANDRASTMGDGGHTSHAQPKPRKMPLVPSKSGLTSHSAMSMVKKAAAGIQEGTSPYHKAIYQDKKIIECLDKYVLARAEGANTWSNYMGKDQNSSIKGMYDFICKLDTMWVNQQMEYRKEIPEQRKLFKRLMIGENEIQKLYKQATAAAAKVTKIGKNLDDALLKNRASKGGLDMRKLEQLQCDLEQATKDDEAAQKSYATGIANHQKFKYNEIRKMMYRRAEAEVALYQDCWRLAETKLHICKLFMEGGSYSHPNNVHRASEESKILVQNLRRELEATHDISESAPLPLRPESTVPRVHPGFNRAMPSAPIYNSDVVSLRSNGSTRSTDSSGLGSDVAEFDACYNPIPDDSDDETNYDAGYIYDFPENEFDEPEVYENVQANPVSKYLELVDETQSGGSNPPSFPPPVAPAKHFAARSDSEQIFASFSDLHLPSRDEEPEEYSYVDNANVDDEDEEGGTYGHVWEAESGITNSTANIRPLPSRMSQESMISVENTRYVRFPGSIGDRPASSKQHDMNTDIEEKLRKSFAEFKLRKERSHDQPPPLPVRRRRDDT